MKQVKLERDSELQIEVAKDAPLRLHLLSGRAEAFGIDLPQKIWLTFPPGLNFSISTWFGASATIEMDGAARTVIIPAERTMSTYMIQYAILLDILYHHSQAGLCKGRRVIVVGPNDSGKSTMSRILLSRSTGWATSRPGCWKPTFVDLDVGQGSITIPGCIAATRVEKPIDPWERIPLESPLIYFYGHVTPSNNVELYKVLVKELAMTLERQLAENADYQAAGMVINTMGWTDGSTMGWTDAVGYDLLLHAIRALKADVIIILDQGQRGQELCSMLQEDLVGEPKVDVMNPQRLGGVVSRNSIFRHMARSHRIREYFYGFADDVSPHSNIANFSDLFVYRIGGEEFAADPTRVVPVNINHDLLHSVLAVSLAKEPEEIISSKVAGFIYVTDIDIKRKKITYLTPFVELPSKYLIMGSLAWHEPLNGGTCGNCGAQTWLWAPTKKPNKTWLWDGWLVLSLAIGVAAFCFASNSRRG